MCAAYRGEAKLDARDATSSPTPPACEEAMVNAGCNRWRHRQQARIVGVGLAYVGTRCLGYLRRYRYGTRVCAGGSGVNAGRGITLDTTCFTSSNRSTSRSRMRHERRHKQQWMRYGDRFAYMCLGAGSNPCHNRWERRAGWRDRGEGHNC
ncbi:hypothetical protein [Streptomyces sp. Ru72]|uniref:hypothetical protein n=1 Tax=Streptomyces sp. Ru72 TaxID=2080747 RepID=UPI0011B011A0|nr:hypothetical protein [Streptomyces sp. Ru72]